MSSKITATAKKVYVIREKYDSVLEVDIFQLDVRNPVNLIAGKKFKIKKPKIIKKIGFFIAAKTIVIVYKSSNAVWEYMV